MNSEKQTKIKAVILYVIVAVAAVCFMLYFYGARNNIRSSREAIYKEKLSINLIGELVKAVDDIQGSIYSTFSSKSNLSQIKNKISGIDKLADTLSIIYPLEKEKLQRISKLLSEQYNNIISLNTVLNRQNPVTAISQILDTIDIAYTDSLLVTNIIQDTVIVSSPNKRNFLQRFADLFSPNRDSSVIALSVKTDTVKLGVRDTTRSLIVEVDSMARNAGAEYDANIKDIENQIDRLMLSNGYISSQISSLLLGLHGRSVDSTIKAVEKSEAEIKDNYGLAIVYGIIALLLILLFIVMIITDISSGYRARKELEAANAKIKEVMESRHQLMLGVSHDIKSPLSSIIGYLQLAEQQTPQIRSMLNSSRYILSLVENMLTFFNLKEGSKINITKNRFNTDDICRETGEMFEPVANAKGLNFRYSSSNATVLADEMKIRQVINNIVSNAVKYTAKGEVALFIDCCDSNIHIAVVDTGAGMPEEKLQELYKPFTRLESNSSMAHGSGLGMYVVKGLCDLLGGKLVVESEVGKGTRIEIVIPVEICDYGGTVTGNGEEKRIAVFDDDPAVAEVARQMLARLGHKVVDEDYNIILTDMEMCELSGMDVLASAGDIPVVLMSGRSDFSQSKAVALGFAAYIPKPFTINDMRAVFGNGLNEMLGDDYEHVMELFKSSTKENISLLQEALDKNDFAKAQAVCHKMYPMFAQLGYRTEELKKIDASRGCEYLGWQQDVILFLKNSYL